MTGPNVPTPSALVSGIPVRGDLTEAERGALLRAAERYRGIELLEIADALGLCGPPPTGTGYLAGTGNARISPDFGSGRLAPR